MKDASLTTMNKNINKQCRLTKDDQSVFGTNQPALVLLGSIKTPCYSATVHKESENPVCSLFPFEILSLTNDCSAERLRLSSSNHVSKTQRKSTCWSLYEISLISESVCCLFIALIVSGLYAQSEICKLYVHSVIYQI